MEYLKYLNDFINDAPFMVFLKAIGMFIAATFCIGIGYYAVNSKSKKYMMQALGWPGFCLIGFVGTIVHELSHLLVSILFLHIPTKVQLFRPVLGRADGILGSVENKYKPTKYRKAGNFFIGFAPMMAGAWITVFLLKYIGLDMFKVVSLAKEQQWEQIWKTVKSMPVFNGMFSWDTILVIFVTVSILINMDMSKKDYQNSIIGSAPFIVFAVIAYWSMRLFQKNDIAEKISDIVSIHVTVLIGGLLLCVVVLFTNFSIAKVVKMVKRILHKKL